MFLVSDQRQGLGLFYYYILGVTLKAHVFVSFRVLIAMSTRSRLFRHKSFKNSLMKIQHITEHTKCTFTISNNVKLFLIVTPFAYEFLLSSFQENQLEPLQYFLVR